jgi:two-component system cell cycle response regulator DivK
MNKTAEAPEGATVAGARILIVEDNEENMRLFMAVLRLEGATEVFGADSAAGGIAIAEQEQPDIILMDIQMPEMDGITATRRLKSNPETAPIPVVAVTASVLESDRQDMQEAGCAGYISKPIDPFEFSRQIARFLALNASETAKARTAEQA